MKTYESAISMAISWIPGDNGNSSCCIAHAKQAGHQVETDLVSLGDDFKVMTMILSLLVVGRITSKGIIAHDIGRSKTELERYIGIWWCLTRNLWWLPIFGQYYMTAEAGKIECLGILPHKTERQERHSLHRDIVPMMKSIKWIYYGFES